MRGLSKVLAKVLTRVPTKVLGVSGIVLVAIAGLVGSATASAADDRNSVVIVFKDGHRQSFAMAEVSRIDFNAPSLIVYRDGRQEKISTSDIARIEFGGSSVSEMMPGRGHFVGKWEVGQGNGENFFITLDADGEAKKTLGAPHGTWTLVDGEARISWEDGWHDVIRKVGTKHEKRAYEPGKSFEDEPNNVTSARNTQPKPI